MIRQFSPFILTLALLSGAVKAQDSLNVTKLGQVSLMTPVGVTVEGDYAYVACEWLMCVVDVSNPAAPIAVGGYNFPGTIEDRREAVAGDYAYAAVEPGGILVVNISDPTLTYWVGAISLPGTSYGVAVVENLAYVAAYGAGLRIVDISNPINLFEVGYYDTPGESYDLAIAGNYAYVADGTGGLRVVDIAVPAAPTEISYCPTGITRGVTVAGDYAYVAASGLRIVDISDPATPFEVGDCILPAMTYDVAVVGNYVYVADGTAGLRVVDISNPVAPFEVGYYNTPQTAYDVAVDGSYAYVADWYYLEIYQFFPMSELVTITLTPINPPIVIPSSGGSFSYNATINNQATIAATFDVWIMVQLPSQTWYGPVLGPLILTMPASASLTRLRNQSVPGSAPAGNYWYEARIGDYPYAVWDTSGFGFTKSGFGIQSASGGSGIVEWTNTGEEFVGGTRSVASTSGSGATPTMEVMPNPFNPSTAISFELRAASFVNLKVYDTTGRLVETLVDGWREAGEHRATFDGSGLPSGVYLYHLQAGEQAATGKMVLLK